MPFEAAPFGVTGLETAFAALYTHLVGPGCSRSRRCSSACRPARRAPSGSMRRGIAAGAPANLVLLDLDRELARDARTASARGRPTPGSSARRCAARSALTVAARSGGVRGDERAAFSRSRTARSSAASRSARRASRSARRSSRPAMTGYQEVVTDPSFAEQIVCFTAPMVGNYGVADGRSESDAAARARPSLMREARGPAWTDWLHERGDRRAHRHRHALARAAPARPRRDARGRGGGRRLRRGGGRRGARAAVDGGARARRRGLDDGAVRLRRRRAECGSPSSTTAQALDPAPARGRGRRRDRRPRTTSTRTRSRASTACCSRTAPAIPSRSRRRSPCCASCSGGCRSSASASATSCSRSRPATRRSSCRSATAARTIPCSSGRPATCSSRVQNHGFAVRAERRRGGDARLALRRHGRGPRLPRAARALGAVPPGGRPRPARRVADHRDAGSTRRTYAAGALTSSRSA